MDPMVVVQIESSKRLRNDANNALDGFFEFFVAGARIAVGRLVQAGILHDGLAPRSANLTNGFVARNSNGGLAKSGRKLFPTSQAQQAQQVLVALDMAIKSRLTDAKFFGDSGQGERIEAFGISDLGGGIDDPLLV